MRDNWIPLGAALQRALGDCIVETGRPGGWGAAPACPSPVRREGRAGGIESAAAGESRRELTGAREEVRTRRERNLANLPGGNCWDSTRPAGVSTEERLEPDLASAIRERFRRPRHAREHVASADAPVPPRKALREVGRHQMVTGGHHAAARSMSRLSRRTIMAAYSSP